MGVTWFKRFNGHRLLTRIGCRHRGDIWTWSGLNVEFSPTLHFFFPLSSYRHDDIWTSLVFIWSISLILETFTDICILLDLTTTFLLLTFFICLLLVYFGLRLCKRLQILQISCLYCILTSYLRIMLWYFLVLKTIWLIWLGHNTSHIDNVLLPKSMLMICSWRI